MEVSSLLPESGLRASSSPKLVDSDRLVLVEGVVELADSPKAVEVSVLVVVETFGPEQPASRPSRREIARRTTSGFFILLSFLYSWF